jgi:hypothetical protein
MRIGLIGRDRGPADLGRTASERLGWEWIAQDSAAGAAVL